MSEPIDLGNCDDCGELLEAMVTTPNGKRRCLRCAIPVLAEHLDLPPEELAAIRAIDEAHDREN